ncbi:MAG: hypothetical protein Q8Q67_00740 [bacterium]|nr:hypothetical protein [bacterium]
MESVEFFRELVSLPIFYLGLIVFGMLINMICMLFVNYHAFGWLHGRDRDKGWRISDMLIKIQIGAVIIQVASLVTLVIGLVLTKDLLTPFF